MEFKELLKHRKSTRAFTGEAVTRAQLDEMLDCGIHAPNACNAQSWHFFCTLDKNFINGLVPDVYKGQWITDAGCIILLCTDPGVIEARFGSLARERFAVQDTAAAATQILQCATVLGLSGCWLGAFDHDKAREAFGVPAEMEPVIMLAVGKAVTEPPMRPRKPLSEVVTIIGECESSDDSVDSENDRYIVRGTQLKDALFDNMKMSNMVFNHSVMENAVFDDINMAGTKFNNINLEGAAFTDINLKTAHTAVLQWKVRDLRVLICRMRCLQIPI